MIFVNLIFSVVVLVAAMTWVGRVVHRAWLRRMALRNVKPEEDHFWASEKEPFRRHSADEYAARHQTVFEDEDSLDDSWEESGWHVKHVTTPHRCEICHQSDQFDPVTLCCKRCDHYTH